MSDDRIVAVLDDRTCDRCRAAHGSRMDAPNQACTSPTGCRCVNLWPVDLTHLVVLQPADRYWDCPGRCKGCNGHGEIFTVDADGWEDEWPCGCDGAGFMCGPCHAPLADRTCEHAPPGGVEAIEWRPA